MNVQIKFFGKLEDGFLVLFSLFLLIAFVFSRYTLLALPLQTCGLYSFYEKKISADNQLLHKISGFAHSSFAQKIAH